MNRIQDFSLHTAELNDSTRINQLLLKGLHQYIDDNETRKTHFFMGRYENIYIDEQQIPAIREVLDACIEFSSQILGVSPDTLKAGLWFNVMGPGDKTTLHQHDDDDELLSAVYYVDTPDNSGFLKIGKQAVLSSITPKAGMFVFFPPNMPHEVTENFSSHKRVSLGINIGPAVSQEADQEAP